MVAKPSPERCLTILLAVEFLRNGARVGTRASDAYKVPLALGPRDEPEPDVMVVRKAAGLRRASVA